MDLFIRWPAAALAAMATISVLSLPLAAQDKKQPDSVQVIGETIDVRVVNVEAVVTRGSGERVRGLTAGDFRLLVDGREVPVEYFAEVEEGASVTAEKPAGSAAAPTMPVAAGEAVGRSYLVYVDDSFSLLSRRNAVLDKLERDLTLLRPADRMAVLAFDGSRIAVLSRWTGDVRALKAALEQARQRPAHGDRALAHQRALRSDVDTVAESGLEGDQIQAALEDLSHRVSPEARTQLGRTATAAAAALRGFEAPPGRKVMMLLSGAWSLSVAPQLYSPMVDAANRLGYTVYPVDASMSDAREVTVLDKLARATGGRVMVSAANEAFRDMVADSGSYYWLGFTPTWKADDKGHKVTVEVRRPELTVRSRGAFSDLSKRTETAMKAESVLLFGGAADERRLIVQLGEPRRRGRDLEVPVTLGVPVEALALTPQGKGYLAEVPLAVAAMDGNGGRADLPASHLKVVVATLPKTGTYARFQTVVRLREAGQRLVFTVPDPVSGQALWGEAEVGGKDKKAGK
ncbi:MAG TPA: VWA domain-containing protein [Thermoanaerobaculia bacterium]|nr:VWA domain-containing protein [Thermoanaerobaculia bacterium]